MKDDRLDLSALDPRADEERFERSVAAIARRAAPSLRARRERPTGALWEQLAAWWRPVMVTAAVIAVLSVSALMRARPERTASPASAAATRSSRPGTLLEAAGLPSPLARWFESGPARSGANALDLLGTDSHE